MDLVSAKHRDRAALSVAGRLGLVLLGLCGLFGTGGLLEAWLPRPPDSALSTKLDAFEQHKDEYDVLFVGSSHVFRHVDPALFDRCMAHTGRPTRSYNLGVQAMQGLETLVALRAVLALEPARLRWVLVDARDQGHILSGSNHLTARVAGWHDLRTTWLACRLVLSARGTWSWTLDQVGRHLTAFGYHIGRVGRLRALIQPRLVGNPEYRAALLAEREADRTMERGRALDGYAPLDWAVRMANAEQFAMLMERRTSWLAEAKSLLEALPAEGRRDRPLLDLEGEPRPDQGLLPSERQLLGEMVEEVQRAGHEVVFINNPDLRQVEYLMRAGAREGLLPAVLDLDDPRRYPAFYREDMRFDRDHLNERGATLYTSALAEAFARHLGAADVRR